MRIQPSPRFWWLAAGTCGTALFIVPVLFTAMVATGWSDGPALWPHVVGAAVAVVAGAVGAAALRLGTPIGRGFAAIAALLVLLVTVDVALRVAPFLLIASVASVPFFVAALMPATEADQRFRIQLQAGRGE